MADLGCTIACDGWSSTTNRPLLNVVCKSLKSALFFKSYDTIGKKKTAKFIAKFIAEFIFGCIEEDYKSFFNLL